MKNLYLFLFLTMCTLGLTAQEVTVPTTQKVLITKKTATWCPFCGEWGWTFFRNLMEDNADDAVFIAAHYSGDLANGTASAIVANFGGSSQPRFYINHTDQNVLSSLVSTKRTDIKQKVADLAAQRPVVQAGIAIGSDGQVLQLAVKTEFFQAAEGEYFLGIYVVEKEVIASQSGQGANAKHTNVLRDVLADDWYGQPLAGGSIEAGEEQLFFEEYPTDGFPDLEQLKIVTIIWKKGEGDKYEVVNVNESDDIQSELLVGTSCYCDEELGTLTVAPNPATDYVQIQLQLETALPAGGIELIDQLGRTVARLDQWSQLPSGEHSRRYDLPDNLAKGMYLLRLHGGEARWQRWIVVN